MMWQKIISKRGRQVNTILVILVTVVLLLNVVFYIRQTEYVKDIKSQEELTSRFAKQIKGLDSCPSYVGGNNESFFRIKYFYTDFCPWCKKEDKVLEKIFEKYGNLFFVEWYNLLGCEEIASNYEVGGVPTFVFSVNDTSEFSRFGFIPRDDFEELICDVTGVC